MDRRTFEELIRCLREKREPNLKELRVPNSDFEKIKIAFNGTNAWELNWYMCTERVIWHLYNKQNLKVEEILRLTGYAEHTIRQKLQMWSEDERELNKESAKNVERFILAAGLIPNIPLGQQLGVTAKYRKRKRICSSGLTFSK